MNDKQKIEELERANQDLEKRLKTIENVLFGIQNDTRFKAKVQKQVITGKTSTDLPIIDNGAGVRWSITNVTKLN